MPLNPSFLSIKDIDYLKQLKAKVYSVKLFEDKAGAPTPFKQRVYKTKFAKTDTRYIVCELRLVHEIPRKHRLNFPLKAVLKDNSNNMLTDQTTNTYVEPQWKRSHHSIGIGWNDYGKWLIGTYKIELYVGNKKVSEKMFEVFDTQ